MGQAEPVGGRRWARRTSSENGSPDISAAQAEYIRLSNEARDERERELVKLRQDAEQQAKFSRSRELAAAAIQDLDTDPERSILLALQASQTYTGEAHNALQKALEKSRIVARSERHTGSVHTVAYSPVAELVASGGEDGLVRLWDLNAGDDAPPIDVKAQVTGLAFRHDGKHLAASCKDRSLRIWNVETRAVEQLWYAHSPLTCVAFNDDGSRVAAGAVDGSVLVWTSSGRADLGETRSQERGGARRSPGAVGQRRRGRRVQRRRRRKGRGVGVRTSRAGGTS